MNNQEAFEKSARWILNQEKPCVNYYNGCIYAGEDGQACAVGCLLPREVAEGLDKLGEISWESVANYGRDSESNNYSECKAAVAALAGVDDELLIELQRVHDYPTYKISSTRADQLKPKLISVAQKFGLKLIPELL